MKISIITVVYNAISTIATTIQSVLNQRYPNIEYIIVDGGSCDGTLDIINSFVNLISKFHSGEDNGIYDAMNTGIKLAEGDVIGFLNADDFYIDGHVISKVVNAFAQNEVDSIFADLVFVKPNNLNRIVRYYKSSTFHPSKFAYGLMPAHPTFFAKRKIYEKYGLFKTDYMIAADFEILVRFLSKNNISYCYIPEVFVKMRIGGASTKSLKSNLILNREIVRACKENGIETNIIKVYSKYLIKIFQMFERPQ
jgi:glycosyltransferase involved in cell wall biosynthesis